MVDGATNRLEQGRPPAGAAFRSKSAPVQVRSVLAGLGLGAVFVGLFGRVMAFPLRHDEQMYLPVATMLSRGSLYADYGFNNLPNLPLLMHAVFDATGTDHVLLAGRLVIFAGWLVAAAAMGLLVRRVAGSAAAAWLAVLLLLTCPLLLGPAGMLVTNNFLGMPLTLLAACLLVAGVERPLPAIPPIAAAGLCLGLAAGFKANYVFALPPFACAVLLVPRGLSTADRIGRVALPFAAGGLIGAVPVLAYLLDDPAGFLAHVIGYHSGPHVAYWSANEDLDGAKVMDAAGKLRLAARVWFLNPFGLVLAALAIAGAATMRHRGDAALPRWPVALLAGLLLCGTLISFVPTPAFPQYYAPPVPYAIALAAILAARLPKHRPVLPLAVTTLLAGAVLFGLPRPAIGVANAFRTTTWTGLRTHEQGREIAALVAADGAGSMIATLSPLHAVEGGLDILPELATGPLVYRVGDLIPREQRRFYRLISPTTIAARLERAPPAAILIGFEGRLDAPLARFARRHGYRVVPLGWERGRYGEAVLLLRAEGVRARDGAARSISS